MFQKALKKIGESSFFSRKTPHFWYVKNSLAAELLIPVSVIYFLAKRAFVHKGTPVKFDTKVICVGNAIAGGSGKTPTACAIMKRLKQLKPNAKIAFVTTGFKGELYGPVLVDVATHKFNEVGDEALLLANSGPTIICKERLKALEFAVSQGFEYVILDDGLHDKKFVKDVTFLVIDGKYGFGNGLLIPAGPLRDRMDFATEGTDHVIMIGADKNEAMKKLKYASGKDYPVVEANINIINEIDKTQVYVAFAGIGFPKKFFDMLREKMKLVVPEVVEFADHHTYADEDYKFLTELAQGQKAKLITTEKDLVKLSPEFAAKVDCVYIALQFDDNSIDAVLEKI